MKHNPGPAPTSCLTCRQRKKKCDKSRPTCKRCDATGHVCLGYQLGNSGTETQDRGEDSQNARLGVKGVNKGPVASASLSFAHFHINQELGPVSPFQQSTGLSDSLPQSYFDWDSTCSPTFPSDSDASSISKKLSPPNPNTRDRDNSMQQTLQLMAAIRGGYSLPPRFAPNPRISGTAVGFIMSQSEPMFELVFFRPIRAHLTAIRGKYIARILSSDVTYWSSYIAARIFQSLKQDGEYAKLQQFVPQINQLSKLCITGKNDTSLDDMVGRLSGALELVFLTYMASSAKASYALLQHISPLFMQIAFADPRLWPRDPSSNGISLAHALAFPQFELGQFIFLDMVTSLTFGTPPLVEYDTSHPISRVQNGYVVQWIRGCPARFVFSIMRISQWRARHPVGFLEEDRLWKEIEDDTWTWRSFCDYAFEVESSKLVMRLAVQEGWRHATLIYLYLGMCGVNSHDPRVQSSARQISHLYAIIQYELAAVMHFHIPILLGAICTRRETDRGRFRKAISQMGHNGTWLLLSMNFTAVLDRLWHTAAADGRPVTWDDYVNSRRAVIDLDM